MPKTEQTHPTSIKDSPANTSQNDPWTAHRDRLIPQKTVRMLRGDISNMTIFRHVRKKLIPPPIVIDGRNYWKLGEILDANEADSKRRQ